MGDASMKKVAWPGIVMRSVVLACTCAGAPSSIMPALAAPPLAASSAPSPAPASALSATPAGAPGLQVLHWWTSSSERKAADLLAAALAQEGIAWRDAAIPGGAGLGAGKVLKGRVLAGDAPEVTQLIGPSIAEWADLGLLLELDDVADAGDWHGVLFPTIRELVVHRRHVVAAPLGIHRVNTLYYNRPLFARLGLAPPVTWREFEDVARRLRAAGVAPLAQSSEAWQVAALFENLVLAGSGPAFYRELFVARSPAAAADRRTEQALLRLRAIKGWLRDELDERPWPEVVRRFAHGQAGMMIMGDWAKAELAEHRALPDREFGCAAAPDTAGYHLYSVDTLAMFALDYRRMAAQQGMARLLLAPGVQAGFNALKGGVPVRRDADPAAMDSCARQSWTVFARGAAVQAPSLVHRMAVDEAGRDAIIAEVHRFFLDDRVPPSRAQRRLGALFRLFNLKPPGVAGAQDTDRGR